MKPLSEYEYALVANSTKSNMKRVKWILTSLDKLPEIIELSNVVLGNSRLHDVSIRCGVCTWLLEELPPFAPEFAAHIAYIGGSHEVVYKSGEDVECVGNADEVCMCPYTLDEDLNLFVEVQRGRFFIDAGMMDTAARKARNDVPIHITEYYHSLYEMTLPSSILDEPEIADGPPDTNKLKEAMYVTMKGDITRQIRPTQVLMVKELWSGTANGMSQVGRICIDPKHVCYSGVVFTSSPMLPLALKEWGDLLVRYINYITENKP